MSETDFPLTHLTDFFIFGIKNFENIILYFYKQNQSPKIFLQKILDLNKEFLSSKYWTSTKNLVEVQYRLNCFGKY